jgi:hypothetical protein
METKTPPYDDPRPLLSQIDENGQFDRRQRAFASRPQPGGSAATLEQQGRHY